MREKAERYHVAVVGGGASGMAAAIAAARESIRMGKQISIAVVEKNPRVGKKLLLTGNGRCNLTNRAAGKTGFYGDIAFVEDILREYSPEKVLDLFVSMGLLCREEEDGRMYPQSGQASSVLDVLRLYLEKYKVSELCGRDVSDIKWNGKEFRLETSQGPIESQRLILAAGGQAAPQTGSDGAGIRLAKSLGHTCTKTYPSLVQLRTAPELVKSMKGMRSQAVVCLMGDGKLLKREEGELQFSDGTLSGICVFQLSRMAAEWLQMGTVEGEPYECWKSR